MVNPVGTVPSVSVLMPVYNAKRYLGESIDSILNQSFADFEFIIVDDGSTDGSATILDRYARLDNRITVLRVNHAGVAVALNRGLDLCSGIFLARMDADDIAHPARFRTQVAYLLKNQDCVAVGSQVLRIDPQGWPISRTTRPTKHDEIDRRHLIGDTALCHPAVMMRRDVVDAVGRYSAEYSIAEDYDLWLRLAEHGMLANLSDCLLQYRLHFESVMASAERRLKQREQVEASLRQACQRRGLAFTVPKVLPQRPSSRVEVRLSWVTRAMESKNFKTALKHLMLAVLESPGSRDAWILLYPLIRRAVATKRSSWQA